MSQYSLHRRRAFFSGVGGINAESNIAARHASTVAWARNRTYLRGLAAERALAAAPVANPRTQPKPKPKSKARPKRRRRRKSAVTC